VWLVAKELEEGINQIRRVVSDFFNKNSLNSDDDCLEVVIH